MTTNLSSLVGSKGRLVSRTRGVNTADLRSRWLSVAIDRPYHDEVARLDPDEAGFGLPSRWDEQSRRLLGR